MKFKEDTIYILIKHINGEIQDIKYYIGPIEEYINDEYYIIEINMKEKEVKLIQ